jgi:hypothetical protein
MAETTDFLLLGLAMTATVVSVYIGSLILRFRRADQAEATLETLREP